MGIVPQKLHFIKGVGPDSAADYLGRLLKGNLHDGKKVAWFLSGGSSIDVAVLASKLLKNTPGKLLVSLVDERYGQPGHPDSNWQQLQTAGLSLPGAITEPPLRGDNLSITVEKFNNLVLSIFQTYDFKIALLGIGADGHIAGLLSGSLAVNSQEYISYYQTDDYERLTLTPWALSQLNEAVVYAQGESKHQALDNLDKELPIDKQPAQILKQIPKVTIFNDYKGDGL